MCEEITTVRVFKDDLNRINRLTMLLNVNQETGKVTQADTIKYLLDRVTINMPQTQSKESE